MGSVGTVGVLVVLSPTGDRWPVVVVGAGAAGMMAAIHAGRAGVGTLVLETARRPGAKIRVSGGGRCNVLPSEVAPDDFHTEGSSHAMRNILMGWPLDEVTAFFRDDLDIPLRTEATGKVFPVSDEAGDVVAALLDAVEAAGARLVTGARVTGLRVRADGGFDLDVDGHDTVVAARVVVATGGLSLPKTGSDGAGFRFLDHLGHHLLDRYPALVPITTSRTDWAELAGVAVPATITAHRDGPVWSGSGDLLVTHRGFSGPVALDASHQVAAPWGAATTLTALFGPPDVDWDALLQTHSNRTVVTAVRDHLPRRLAERLCRLADLDLSTTTSTLRREDRLRLVSVLTACPLEVDGDEGYRVAEVTGGGVRLEELVTRTLESRLVPGLYVAGEAIDVTGRLGGFNFLWAWASGRRAGLAAAAR